MQPPSLHTSSTRVEKQHSLHLFTYLRWMHLFFTEGVSQSQRRIADLQRRAVWISLALLLQTIQVLDETHHDWNLPRLQIFGRYTPIVVIGTSCIALMMAFHPTCKRQENPHLQTLARYWQRLILILMIFLALMGMLEFGRILAFSFQPPLFSNDGTSLDVNAAILLLEGRNPYTDSNILDVVHRFSIPAQWTTPLRRGQLTNHSNYPSGDELGRILQADLKTGVAPEFESKVSYPALSFLTLVPFALVKDYNVLPFYLLCYLLLVYTACRAAQPKLRPWILFLALANIPMWGSLSGTNLDLFYILLVVTAWFSRNHRWHSAMLLGLALAAKQLAWFFIPFYLIMIYRHYNLKEVLYRLLIAGAVALIFNLPFMLWNFHAWLAGILAPISDPMFPLGSGLVSLGALHLLPLTPSFYTILEALAIVLSLVWYWRICRERPEAAMFLAIFPLFFAWRSLSSYFYCMAYPLFVLMAAKTQQTLQDRPTTSIAGILTIPNKLSQRNALQSK